jgi:hypothetical protein
VEQEEGSLSKIRKLEWDKELYVTLITCGIEGIALEAIDEKSGACVNHAFMGPELEEIIREISPEDERTATSVDRKMPGNDGYEMAAIKRSAPTWFTISRSINIQSSNP